MTMARLLVFAAVSQSLRVAALRAARQPLSYIDGYVEEFGANATPFGTPADASGSTERRHVIVAKYDEDVAWLKRLPANYEVAVYQSLNNTEANYTENFGNEASKYLKYIVDNYDSLPDSMVFTQAGQQDWHDPVRKEITLSSWDWTAAKQSGGMMSLPTAAPCLVEDTTQDPGASSRHWPAQPRCSGVAEHVPKQLNALKEAWPIVFEDQLGPMPDRWLTHCCAQFEVTREAVTHHPKEFYAMLFDWVMRHDQQLLHDDTDAAIQRNHDPDRKDAGHIMEITWALVFGMQGARIF